MSNPDQTVFNSLRQVPASKLQIIALKLQVVAPKLQIIALKLQIVASKLQLIALKLQIVATKLQLIAPKLQIVALKLQIVATKPVFSISNQMIVNQPINNFGVLNPIYNPPFLFIHFKN